ncbi:tRNA (adenosine(37)-N6)-threonylcarbamoyltransferase complex transferase subunit TsaD [Coraliomargarita sp. SDUM461003]|uniref:N(6)-L-threonylcarbamoyladenine synthase n=1 Tax=Thalassobacterium maritimum TaxID=3041265 RepID=A0ABU1AU54_9BACT|nr:tRNA (adenosine(37)-N6)-threonylcarbamoyltransferase complex transferase subunit TsaD [Coraliomargarita sp. SDUM461003]MDQ8207691.1 tRNA (adenosine(37)-N6)-threonylcarbamoyltransferase complex transferase subunit TsaD [Coraliomargarita sp. SDUM461003]
MILAIESSCDESALARFDPASGLVGEWVHTQIDLHKEYGGVVPDLASREHLKNFFPLLSAAGLSADRGEITQIAVTHGPGLAGCLALGMAFARSLAVAWNLPVVGVNHLRGHAYSPFIALHQQSPQGFAQAFEGLLPHLGLIVSGGNTILFQIDMDQQLTVLAETVDDAAGEALDKGAKLLGLPYPGGPQVERLAAGGDASVYDFPKAIAPRNERRFSFSGLKTSLRYRLEKMSDSELEAAMPDICAGYQGAVIDQLVGKTKHLIQAAEYRSLGLSGGVSNNRALRAAMARLAKRFRLSCHIAQPQHTGDNAAMIAFAAFADQAGLAQGDFSIEPALRLAQPAAQS